MNCAHWFGIPPEACDVPHWIPYLDADAIGADAERKLTLVLHSDNTDGATADDSGEIDLEAVA